jgi:phosphoribosylamine--glycine ligase
LTRVLIVGGGGREHAIGWKLRHSDALSDLFFAPGNGGTSTIGTNLPVRAADVPSIVRSANDLRVELVFVGPEEPLALGLADELERVGIRCFGPSRAAARIEASKHFAKDLMDRAGVPTARWETFTEAADAKRYVLEQPMPVVVKADGLAAGKGVAVCQTVEDATAFIDQAMALDAFGEAGSRIVIEECLVGTEVSAFALCDGTKAAMTVPACDYKPIGDGNTGPNTGGMGSYSPSEFVSSADLRAVHDDVFVPVLAQMRADGNPFRGILYAGLMVHSEGTKVLEFNCRMGDPEAQVVLPRLRGDLLASAISIAEGSIPSTDFEWDERPRVGIVIASEGYPGRYETGVPIAGLDEIDSDTLVFHAGTTVDARGQLVTAGGRVLTVVGTGTTMMEAREAAYRNAERVRFKGAQYRRDIALRAVTDAAVRQA